MTEKLKHLTIVFTLIIALFTECVSASEFDNNGTQSPMFDILDGTLKAYNGNSAKVIIPDGVRTIGENAFYDNDTVQELVLPDSVTYINSYAFAECSCLSKVHLSKNLISIGKYAFAWDDELKVTLILPEGLQILGERAFCAVPATIRIPKSVKSLGLDLSGSKLEVYRNTAGFQYALNYLENDMYDVIDAVDIATLPCNLLQTIFAYAAVPSQVRNCV